LCSFQLELTAFNDESFCCVAYGFGHLIIDLKFDITDFVVGATEERIFDQYLFSMWGSGSP
jgi:hypothetical protein